MLGRYLVRECRGWNRGCLMSRRRTPYVCRGHRCPGRGIITLTPTHRPRHGIRRPTRVRGVSAKLRLRREILGFVIVHMIIILVVFYGGWWFGRRWLCAPCGEWISRFGVVVERVTPGVPVEVIHRLRSSGRGNTGVRPSHPSGRAVIWGVYYRLACLEPASSCSSTSYFRYLCCLACFLLGMDSGGGGRAPATR